MIGFALHRLVSLLASLIVASLVVFAAVEIVPGAPARFMLGINAAPGSGKSTLVQLLKFLLVEIAEFEEQPQTRRVIEVRPATRG